MSKEGTEQMPRPQGTRKQKYFSCSLRGLCRVLQPREPVEVTGSRLKENMHVTQKQGNEQISKKSLSYKKKSLKVHAFKNFYSISQNPFDILSIFTLRKSADTSISYLYLTESLIIKHLVFSTIFVR